jgi:hypothetical protein
MAILFDWPDGKSPSVPKETCEAESEAVSMYRARIVKLQDWPYLIIDRRWEAGQMFRYYFKIRLTSEQFTNWFAVLQDINEWANCDPESFERAEKKAA